MRSHGKHGQYGSHRSVGEAASLLFGRLRADRELASAFAEADDLMLRRYARLMLVVVLDGGDAVARAELMLVHSVVDLLGSAFDRAVSHLEHVLEEFGTASDAVDFLTDRMRVFRPEPLPSSVAASGSPF